MSIDGHDTTAATSTLVAGTSEHTMFLADVYWRAGRWRVRATGLAHLGTGVRSTSAARRVSSPSAAKR